MISAEKFVELFGKEQKEKLVKFAAVASVEDKPTLLFDGETVPSVKKYPCLTSYSPQVGDRVIVLNGVVLGAIS